MLESLLSYFTQSKCKSTFYLPCLPLSPVKCISTTGSDISQHIVYISIWSCFTYSIYLWSVTPIIVLLTSLVKEIHWLLYVLTAKDVGLISFVALESQIQQYIKTMKQ